MKWDDAQERADALSLTWPQFRKLYPTRNKGSYHHFRRDYKAGLRRNFEAEGDKVERPNLAFVTALEREEISVGNKTGRKKLTVGFGDVHLGDKGHLYPCWQECKQGSVDLAQREQPDEIELDCVGDLASGRGIFRNQEIRNVLPLAQPQMLWASWEIRGWVEELKQVCPKADVRGRNTLGNHDLAMGENLAYILPILMHLFGVEWKYCGRQVVFSLAAEGEQPFLALMEHGWGHSSYYANSYSQIRGTWQALLDMDRRNEGHPVRRVLSGHTHWLNIGHVLAPGRALDTVGGFQRQDRLSLPATGRPVGFISYLHDGRTMTVQSITPRQETVDKLQDDSSLDLRSGMIAFQQLLEIGEYLKQKGLTV